MKLVIVIPAFNEGSVVYKVLRSLPSKIKGISKREVVVVDDGSVDNTSAEALRSGATILKHPINRGAGAATKTGILWAKKKNPDVILTFDADGQHRPDEIRKVLDPVLNGSADLVIGSRFLRKQNVPVDRYFLNWAANMLTLILFGTFSTDTQSGFRALSKKAFNLIDFKNDRMEFSSEILIDAKKHKLRVKEVPIAAIYTKYSREKGQKNINSLVILSRLLVKIFR